MLRKLENSPLVRTGYGIFFGFWILLPEYFLRSCVRAIKMLGFAPFREVKLRKDYWEEESEINLANAFCTCANSKRRRFAIFQYHTVQQAEEYEAFSFHLPARHCTSQLSLQSVRPSAWYHTDSSKEKVPQENISPYLLHALSQLLFFGWKSPHRGGTKREANAYYVTFLNVVVLYHYRTKYYSAMMLCS